MFKKITSELRKDTCDETLDAQTVVYQPLPWDGYYECRIFTKCGQCFSAFYSESEMQDEDDTKMSPFTSMPEVKK